MVSSKKTPRVKAEVIPLFKEKECSACGAMKPWENYSRDRFKSDGSYSQCKPCKNTRQLERARIWRNNNRDKLREKDLWYHRKYEFNLTKEQFFEMLSSQNGCCAICRTVPKGDIARNMHVDHNHDTGEIRGLLCYICNRGLGIFKDSVTILRNAADYLEERGSYGKTKW